MIGLYCLFDGGGMEGDKGEADKRDEDVDCLPFESEVELQDVVEV